jgi:hypothetical protein
MHEGPLVGRCGNQMKVYLRESRETPSLSQIGNQVNSPSMEGTNLKGEAFVGHLWFQKKLGLGQGGQEP